MYVYSVRICIYTYIYTHTYTYAHISFLRFLFEGPGPPARWGATFRARVRKATSVMWCDVICIYIYIYILFYKWQNCRNFPKGTFMGGKVQQTHGRARHWKQHMAKCMYGFLAPPPKKTCPDPVRWPVAVCRWHPRSTYAQSWIYHVMWLLSIVCLMGWLYSNERISRNNRLIGKPPEIITSHDSCQSPTSTIILSKGFTAPKSLHRLGRLTSKSLRRKGVQESLKAFLRKLLARFRIISFPATPCHASLGPPTLLTSDFALAPTHIMILYYIIYIYIYIVLYNYV